MKLLVHLHVYYHNQVDYFIKKLSNISGCDWDLYVTYVEENEVTQNKIKTLKPDAVFMKVENLGYDVLPFIQVIRSINLDDYNYVMKLHTKSANEKRVKVFGCKKHSFKGFFWRNEIVNSLIGSKKQFKANLDLLKKNNNVGMITSKLFFLLINGMSIFTEDTSLLYYLKKRLNIKSNLRYFCAGTMFIIKSDVLNVLKNSDITIEDFSNTSKSHSNGTIAHALERIYGMLVDMYGYKIHKVKVFV